MELKKIVRSTPREFVFQNASTNLRAARAPEGRKPPIRRMQLPQFCRAKALPLAMNLKALACEHESIYSFFAILPIKRCDVHIKIKWL